MHYVILTKDNLEFARLKVLNNSKVGSKLRSENVNNAKTVRIFNELSLIMFLK